MSLSSVNLSDTFSTWRDRTNQIIGRVNYFDTNGITGITGDGTIIKVTKSGTTYTINLSGNFPNAVTFSGNVNISGLLTANNFASTKTQLSISPKTSGLTAGNIVRLVSTGGLTLAKANSAENSEVLGVIVGEDASNNYVAISGQIDTTLHSKIIENAFGIVGATLEPGCAYFLSGVVTGGITTIEPNTYGYVSKPVLLGLTTGAGMILPYRGVLIEGISAGITAELDDKIIIQVNYNTLDSYAGTTWTSFNGANGSGLGGISLGDVVMFYTSTEDWGEDIDPATYWGPITDIWTNRALFKYKLAGIGNQGDVLFTIPAYKSLTGGNLTNLRGNYTALFNDTLASKAIEDKKVLGLVSAIVHHQVGQYYILEVTLPGGVFIANPAELGGMFPNKAPSLSGITSGRYYVIPETGEDKPNNILVTKDSEEIYPKKIEQFPFATVINETGSTCRVIFNYNTQRQYVTDSNGFYGDSTSGLLSPLNTYNLTATSLTGGSGNINLLPNGSFSIWQAPFNGTISGITDGVLNENLSHTRTADRWYFKPTFAGPGYTGSVYFSRGEFDSNQTEVLGSPLYYVNIKNNLVGMTLQTHRSKFEHIQKNDRLLQGQTATLSFYAKSSSSGATLDLIFNRYNNTDSWIYSDWVNASFARTKLTTTGITLTGSWQRYTQTFVVPAMGFTHGITGDSWISFGFEFPNSGTTLSIAQVLLEPGFSTNNIPTKTVEEELYECSKYYQRSYDWDESTGSVENRGNETHLSIGNHNTQKEYKITLPVRMIGSPSVSVYSPISGYIDEAYNINAGQDLRNTPGTAINYPWSGGVVNRYAELSGNITVPATNKYGFTVRLDGGVASLDTISFHWVASSDLGNL